MLIELNEIEYCKVNVKFEADIDHVKNKRFEVIQSLKKQNVPGFRPGKATNEAVEHHFADKIDKYLQTELAYDAFQTVISEKNIKPFGNPEFTSLHLDGLNFKCDFCLHKIPEIELKEYKGLNIPKCPVPNATEMAEKILQELRVRNGQMSPFVENDLLQNGDNAIVDYSGFLMNKEEPVIKVEAEILTMGQAPIESFNENLLGMKVGEKREFTSKLPSDIQAQHLADKEVKFVVELKMASKVEAAPLDDELAKRVGTKNLNELISLAHSMAGSRVQELETQYYSHQVSERLIENHNIQIPNWLTLVEAQMLAKRNEYEWDPMTDDIKEKWLKLGEKSVKLSLILNKIKEEEPDAQLSDEEVINIMRMKFDREIKMSDKKISIDDVLNELAQTGKMSIMSSVIRDDFVIDFVIKNATIAE